MAAAAGVTPNTLCDVIGFPTLQSDEAEAARQAALAREQQEHSDSDCRRLHSTVQGSQIHSTANHNKPSPTNQPTNPPTHHQPPTNSRVNCASPRGATQGRKRRCHFQRKGGDCQETCQGEGLAGEQASLGVLQQKCEWWHAELLCHQSAHLPFFHTATWPSASWN